MAFHSSFEYGNKIVVCLWKGPRWTAHCRGGPVNFLPGLGQMCFEVHIPPVFNFTRLWIELSQVDVNVPAQGITSYHQRAASQVIGSHSMNNALRSSGTESDGAWPRRVTPAMAVYSFQAGRAGITDTGVYTHIQQG